MADEDKQPDKRPRPQFGELAPEGWVWHPPADQNRLDTSRPTDPATTPAPLYGEQRPTGAGRPGSGYPPAAHPHEPGSHASPQDAPAQSQQLTRAAPLWNTGWTIALLIVGLLGMSYSIFILNTVPAAVQLMHTQQGLGAYKPAPAVPAILTVGSITLGAIWLISAAIAIWLLVRRRVSFYVPLVAGVIAFIVLFVFLSLVLSTDPALLDLYSGITPTP